MSAYIVGSKALLFVLLFVNDRDISMLDVSSLRESGDIGVAANFNFEGIPGKSTTYKDFVVYSLDDG